MASRYRSLSKPAQSLCKMVSADVLARLENGSRKDCVSMCSCSHWNICRTDTMPEVTFETMGAMRASKKVVTCKNQQEMNKLQEAAESIGLPTFVVADAGRTQVSSGSRTVLAIGPGSKALVDSVTGKLRLL